MESGTRCSRQCKETPPHESDISPPPPPTKNIINRIYPLCLGKGAPSLLRFQDKKAVVFPHNTL